MDIEEDSYFPPLPPTLPPSFDNNPTTIVQSDIISRNEFDNEIIDDLSFLPPPLPFQFNGKELINDDEMDDGDEDEGFPLPPPEELLSPRSTTSVSTSVTLIDNNITDNINTNHVQDNNDTEVFDVIKAENIKKTSTISDNEFANSSYPSDINKSDVNNVSSQQETNDSVTNEFRSYASVLSGNFKPSTFKKISFNSPAPFKINKNSSHPSNSTIKPNVVANVDSISVYIGDVTKTETCNQESTPVTSENLINKTDIEESKIDKVVKDSGIFSGSETLKSPKNVDNNDDGIADNDVFMHANDRSSETSASIVIADSVNISTTSVTNASTNRTYDSAMRKLSTNNQLNEVIQNYYKDEEPIIEEKQIETETENQNSKKPQKPIIAQALLPKNQRQSDSGLSTTDPNIMIKKQTFNVTLDELKNFLTSETGIKSKLRSADDFYLGKSSKKSSSSDQNENDEASKCIDNNKTTVTKNISKINLNPEVITNQNVPQDVKAKQVTSPLSLDRKKLTENTINTVKNAVPTTADEDVAFNKIDNDFDSKQRHDQKTNSFKNETNLIDENLEKSPVVKSGTKPMKLSKSVSLKLIPGVRPNVPTVKGFTEEQIRQLVENQKSNQQNIERTTKQTFDIQNKTEKEYKTESPSCVRSKVNFKCSEENDKQIEKLFPGHGNVDDINPINSDLDKTAYMDKANAIIENANDRLTGLSEDINIELDLQSKKQFFEQISHESDKEIKKTASLNRSKSVAQTMQNKHKKILNKSESFENELKTVFEKKFQLTENEIEAKSEQNQTTDAIEKITDNQTVSNDDNVPDSKDDVVILPVSEKKAYFESKTSSTSKPTISPKITSLKKSISFMEKSTLNKTSPLIVKPKPKSNVESNKSVETIETLPEKFTEDHASFNNQQVTVETLVNKYTSLKPENVSDVRTKLAARGKSYSLDQKLTAPNLPENTKLPGKSLASLTAKNDETGSAVIGNKSWSATLKNYAQKSNK